MKVTLKSNLPLRKITVGTLAGIATGGIIAWIEECLQVNVPAGVAAILAVVVSFWVSYSMPLYTHELITLELEDLEQIPHSIYREVVLEKEEMEEPCMVR
ncbi:hypothetical protein QNI16_26170 [Cytophagaceae bacterium YF14B1]|uniref:Uncharacterized protein n=1 Tax=Xanthocytophaga flava TaxID=3048013 RepID=A0AAE3QUZ9_9BACT|nr:hypothetical protein [Xanthocytophaga flavus]MDJ1484010.1 hypothetical protein [Xanthocytophaga flavus]